MIRTVQSQDVDYHPSQEHSPNFNLAFFGGHQDEQLLRRQHDGDVRSCMIRIARALQQGTRYSAASDSRRGDSFDLELLTVFATPGIVCTLDGRLRRHVAASRSFQTVQIVSPRELLNDAKAGSLKRRLA